ncbi:Hbt1p TDEL_0A00950 [Torulaspora delbrueckii]|uniref:Uncharacterized protein n=1 Tax=Torulaspora delbrueckii TaxID=4950 RepID=G8ZLD3_TORDE|nr:hypothetical protein TDEL_0A00950 [Torulaspora delbrueckii]CCE89427.1 hypothetical protein TDEL_0A00950 [Torulaspora delbrueckii]
MLNLFFLFKCSKTEEKKTENEREGYPVDAFQEFKKNDQKNDTGFHSTGSYDRILGEGQDDVNTAERLPGSYDASTAGKNATSTSTTKPVQSDLGQSRTQKTHQPVQTDFGQSRTQQTSQHGRDNDPENVSGMYNMNLGEKTNITTGQTKGGHRVDQPLESYIPGVGRSNKASEAMFPHTSETQGGHHISHKDDKPLESYIPGVGRNNHPTEHAAAQQGNVGHAESHQARSGNYSEPHLGKNVTEQHQSKNHTSTPHIPGTGVITEPSQPMSKQKYDPKQNTAYKMDPQQTPHLTQKTAMPGFNYGNKTNAAGGTDTIDRASVPKPAHLNPSPDSGANAPVRRDSRTVNQFHEPDSQRGPSQHVVREEKETVIDFPAHSYDAGKGEGQQKHSTLDPNAGNFGQEAKHHHQIPEEREPTQKKTGIFGHESHGSQHGKQAPAHEAREAGVFGHESHGTQHEKAHDLGREPEGKKTNVFGHESHIQRDTKGADLNASEKSPKSGPTLFGKTINFGGSHKDDTHRDTTHKDASHKAGTGNTATKIGHVNTPNVESKHLPSKVATMEDQPVKSSTGHEGLTKNRTKSIGSEEAGSYAREVGNHPSLVDPRLPTYREKDETFSPADRESGDYKKETFTSAGHGSGDHHKDTFTSSGHGSGDHHKDTFTSSGHGSGDHHKDTFTSSGHGSGDHHKDTFTSTGHGSGDHHKDTSSSTGYGSGGHQKDTSTSTGHGSGDHQKDTFTPAGLGSGDYKVTTKETTYTRKFRLAMKRTSLVVNNIMVNNTCPPNHQSRKVEGSIPTHISLNLSHVLIRRNKNNMHLKGNMRNIPILA